jgi:ferric iron reductase protein FhuF
MVNATSIDMTTLLWFRLSETLNREDLTIEAFDLLSGNLESYVQKVKLAIGAPNEKVAASMIVKRYAFLAAMGIFTMSHSDRKLNLIPSNVTLVSHYEEEHWLPKFYLKDIQFQLMQGDRNADREQYMKDLFANHISLLIHQLSRITNTSKLILWENVAVYLFWLYESVLNSNEERKMVLEDDFHYLFYEAPGSVFGPYNHNPLTKYDSEKVYQVAVDKFIRFRKTCCYSYQLDSKQKRCATCPCFQSEEGGTCQSEQSFCSTIRSVNE